MNFTGTGRRLRSGDYGRAARGINIPTAALLAFSEVESRGQGFDAANRPAMLFEPHVFWRNIPDKLRSTAAAKGVAYRRWVPGKYPRDSYPRLNTAMTIHREGAFRSASYGLFQILGENHAAIGFAKAEEYFADAKRGEAQQLNHACKLIQSWGLDDDLRENDLTKPDGWRPIVERWNGPGYERNNYHTKAATAFNKHLNGTKEPINHDFPVLRYGMRGEAVRNLQSDLQSLGYNFEHGIDGRYGTETKAIVTRFQRDAAITVDGMAGPETQRAINELLQPAPCGFWCLIARFFT